jgi:hypothetical protein
VQDLHRSRFLAIGVGRCAGMRDRGCGRLGGAWTTEPGGVVVFMGGVPTAISAGGVQLSAFQEANEIRHAARLYSPPFPPTPRYRHFDFRTNLIRTDGPFDGPWTMEGIMVGPLYPASIAVRLTRVRGWSALPELVAGAELELQRAGGNVQPNVRPPLDFLVLSPRVHLIALLPKPLDDLT